MPDNVNFVFRQFKAGKHRFVTFNKLGCGKPYRHIGSLRMIFYNVTDRVDSPVHVARTKVKLLRRNTGFRRFYGGLCKLVNTFIFACGNRNDRYAEFRRKLVDIYNVSAGAYLVHHV